MSVESAIAQGQRAAQQLRLDEGVITRTTAGGVLNPNTGLLSADTTTVIHSGPCRVRLPNGIVESEALFGEEQVTTSRLFIDFPHTVTGVEIDDVITVTLSDDADLLSRRFRVLAIPMKTGPLYKGFPCELVE